MTATMAWTPPLTEVHELLAGAPTLTILGQLRDGVMMVNRDGRILYANPAMHDALGSHQDELTGRTAFELGLGFLSDSSNGAQVLHPFDRALRGESVTIDVGRAIVGTPPTHLRWTEMPLFDTDERVRGAMAIARSIAPSPMAPSESSRDDDGELEPDASSEFAAATQHDLRNAVGAIRLRAQMLKRDILRDSTAGRDPAVGREKVSLGLTQIEHSASAMATLLDDLAEGAESERDNVDAPSPRLVDLIALVRRVATDYQPLAPTHRIRVGATAGALVGAWDPIRMERVVVNLLSNAVKYSPSGTTIRVTVGWRRTAQGPLAVLRVRDRGIGIPHADLPRILDGYYRGRNAIGHASGTGVGLMAVRRMVDLHGGTVSVQSTEDRGTKVTVHLPLGDMASVTPGWTP